jgi:hypothetical protein
MKDHQTNKDSHVFETDTVRKLEYKEMLYIRKFKPTINKQTEGELFTLILRNVKLESSMERDVQKYLNKKPKAKISKNNVNIKTKRLAATL